MDWSALPISANSNTRTQLFTTPTLTPTGKNPTMSGRRKRNSASVLVSDVWMCVWDQENSEKTDVGVCRRVLDLGRYTWLNSVPSG